MFTKEQIQTAQAQVKSGADYPALVQAFKQLGILTYTHRVADGANTFYGADNYSVQIAYGQDAIAINEAASVEKLQHALAIHQAGKTNYLTFCLQAGEAGVEQWVSDLTKMTVAYLDKAGKVLIVENIPTV